MSPGSVTTGHPVLMLVTEPQETRDRLIEIVAEAVMGGVNAVMWRDKRERAFSDPRNAQAMLDAVQGRADLFINARPGGAGLIRPGFVSGFHVGEAAADLPGEWERVKSHATPVLAAVGRSVHSVKAALKARDEGADYLLAGTIFASASHPGEYGQGVEYLRDVCTAVAPLPVIAIGGITPDRVGDCVAAGAAGVAVLSAILRAVNPRAVAAQYRKEIEKAWNLRSTESQ